jgi:hypothetical protein
MKSTKHADTGTPSVKSERKSKISEQVVLSDLEIEIKESAEINYQKVSTSNSSAPPRRFPGSRNASQPNS